MGTEVLRPQDVLVDRLRAPPASFHRRRNFTGNGNFTNVVVNRKTSNNNAGYKKTTTKPDKKKFNATADNYPAKKSAHAAPDARRRDDSANGGSPVMGQVTILRRGESLDSLSTKMKGDKSPKSKSPKPKPVDDMAVSGTGRIGPESPEMLPKQIRLSPPPRADVYAGSAFSMSPSPRSLPLPSFFNKKHQDDGLTKAFDDDSATRDLRRLLRLE